MHDMLEQMKRNHPKVMDLSLGRMYRLLTAMGEPHLKLPPVIHVAGTNGKGSTLAMIRAGLEAAGKTAHVYTSPHLARFNERIRLAGHLISDAALDDALREALDKNADQPITIFEQTTCAAFWAMSEVAADFCLLEVGLGGRLDATNVIDAPKVSVITPIALDHQHFLGDTIEEIAAQKAGIIKAGAPVVAGPQLPQSYEVIEAKANEVGAQIYRYGQDWMCFRENERLVFQDEQGLLDLPLPALPGVHQIENAGCALMTLRLLGLGEETKAEAALTQVYWPGRLQRVESGGLKDRAPSAQIWLDGGHNPAAGEMLSQTLGAAQKERTYMISAMMNSKDIRGYLRPMAKVAHHLIGVPIADEPNGLAPQDVMAAAQDVGITAQCANSAEEAIEMITSQDPQARIIICGSLYFLGELMQRYPEYAPQ